MREHELSPMGWRLRLSLLVTTNQIKSNDTILASPLIVAQVRAWLAAHGLGMVKIVIR